MGPSDIQALNDAIKELTKALKKSQSSSTPSSGSRERAGLDTQDQMSVSAFQAKRIKDLDVEIAKHEELASIQKMSLDQQLDLKKELEERQANLLDDNKVLGDHEQRMLDLLTAQGEAKEEILKASADSNKIAKKALKEEEKVLKLQQKIREEREEAASMTANMVHSFGAMLGMSAPKKGGIVDVIGALTSKDEETRGNALEGLKVGIKSMFSPLNIATNLFQKLGELFIYALTKADAASASFAKLTGHGRDLAGASMAAAQALGPVNANLQELAEGVAAAQNALAGVAGRTRLQAAEFGGLSVNLERLGVSMSDFSTIASRDMVAFGATNEEVAQKMANMQAQARALGMSFGEFSSMAASSQASFAAFGSNAEKMFLRAASTARQLGIELSSVVDIGEKFETFDSASSTVADLNYIMGGPFLDTMEMMQLQAEEGPEAVLNKLRESFEQSGKTFEDLHFHQRKALAESMGKTIPELEKIMTGPISDASMEAVEKATDPVDALMSRANSTLTMMEQFARLMESLALTLAEGIFGEKIKDGAALFSKLMKDVRSPDVMNGIISVGKGLMVIGKGAMFIVSGIGKVFNDTANTFGPIGNIIGAVVGKLGTIFKAFASVTGKMGIFLRGLMRFMGPIIGFLEMGKDIAQSMGFFANEEEQARASRRLTGGLAGAAAGGLAGSIIPGLGTLFGASAGYSLGAAGAEAMGGFSRGTDRMLQGGAALVGEKGPEIVTIPAGASVIPNNAFARGNGAFTDTAGAGSTRDVTVHVKLDVNDRKFKEMITLNTVDVIEGRNTVFA